MDVYVVIALIALVILGVLLSLLTFRNKQE